MVNSAILIALLSAVIIGANGNGEFRLPKAVIPTHYDVRLRTEVHRGEKGFQGTVGITVNVVKPTRKIVLHALGIEVRNVGLSDLDGNVLKAPRVNYDKDNQQLVLTRNDELNIGSYILRIEFVTPNNVGWIVRPYEDANGVQKEFLTTQFEPTYARSAFPCFDEPGFKATFSLEVVHHKSWSVDSNMPLIGTPKPQEGNYVISKFERTPKMSTYLLTFTVTEGYRSSGSGNHTTKARESELNKTLYPLEVAKEILGVLDQYTGLPYQDYLPKLTHLEIPIPSNWWRAKENWGLVVYCEDSLLHDPLKNDLNEQRTTLQTISHELAHMWFGNLVTHEWWDHLWIKEGFATLYTYYALHLARPSERWMEWFNLEAIPKGMKHRWINDVIARECKTPWEIRDNYRPAIFERAASVLNMFRQIIGDSAWQLVMRNFLKDHQLDAVVPRDLYREMEKVSKGSGLFPENTTIEKIMNTWLKNFGLPVLVVERNYNDSTITITQHLLERGKAQQWIIPYNYALESDANFDEVGPIHWLAEPGTLIPTNATSDEWILFNKRHFGLCRIKYDERNWKLLAQALRTNISCIPRENRAQLLADALHFHKEEQQIDKSVLFDLLTFLPNETESLVWYAALPVIDLFKQDLRAAKYQDYFKTFLKHLTKRYYDTIQVSPSTSLYDESVRKSVTFLTCQAGNPDCLNSSFNAFRELFLANSSDLLPDDVVNVFCFGSQQASNTEFQWMQDQYHAAEGDERKQRQLMRSLICTKQQTRLRAVIELINKEGRYFNELAEGLTTELSEEQFWMLVKLLQDVSFSDRLDIYVIMQMLFRMNHRKQSEQAQQVLTELKDKFRDKMRKARLGFWYEDYTAKMEDPNYSINKKLEEFITTQIS